MHAGNTIIFLLASRIFPGLEDTEETGRMGFVWLHTCAFTVGAHGLWLTFVSNWLLKGFGCLMRYASGTWKKEDFRYVSGG